MPANPLPGEGQGECGRAGALTPGAGVQPVSNTEEGFADLCVMGEKGAGWIQKRNVDTKV